MVTGFPSPGIRKAGVEEGAAKGSKRQEEPCKGVSTPLNTEAGQGVSWVLHWCSGDYTASAAHRNFSVGSGLQPGNRLEASSTFLCLPQEPSMVLLHVELQGKEKTQENKE